MLPAKARGACRMIPATESQVSYIETLAIDLGMERSRRNKWLCSFLNREIRFVDELSKTEASRVISRMIEMKENRETSNAETA